MFLDERGGRVQWLRWLMVVEVLCGCLYLNDHWGGKDGKFTSSAPNAFYRLKILICVELYSADRAMSQIVCLKLIAKLYLDYTSRYMNKSKVSNQFSIIPLNSSGLH